MPDRLKGMRRFDGPVDVCVIGSGAGGGPMAMELAKAGAKVVVLDKGPWLGREDFSRDEIESCRRNMWTPFLSDEPHLLSRAGGNKQLSAEGWVAHCVGGGTVHMSGFFYRLQPEDFRMASLYGRSAGAKGAELADWPIGYDDLAPWYDKVEREIGVSGLAGEHPREPKRSATRWAGSSTTAPRSSGCTPFRPPGPSPRPSTWVAAAVCIASFAAATGASPGPSPAPWRR